MRKRFFKKCVLLLHLETIHVESKYECKECGQSFSQKGNLRRHVDKRATRDNLCELCDFSASIKGKLVAHINKIHVRIKDKNCEICEFLFSAKPLKSPVHMFVCM